MGWKIVVLDDDEQISFQELNGTGPRTPASSHQSNPTVDVAQDYQVNLGVFGPGESVARDPRPLQGEPRGVPP